MENFAISREIKYHVIDNLTEPFNQLAKRHKKADIESLYIKRIVCSSINLMSGRFSSPSSSGCDWSWRFRNARIQMLLQRRGFAKLVSSSNGVCLATRVCL
jgi:hypothetical protein